MIVVLDILRVVSAAAGLLLAAYQITLIRRARTGGQRALFAGVALTLAVLVTDRLLHLGRGFSWELIATLALIATWAYGAYRIGQETPARDRPRRHEA